MKLRNQISTRGIVSPRGIASPRRRFGYTLLELLLAESVLLLLLSIKLAVVLLLSLVSKLLLTETRTLKVPVIRLSSVVGEILGRGCVLIKSLIRLIYGRTTETKPAAS